MATGSDWPDATVKLWDAATGQELFTLPPSHADKVWNVAFSPDGTLLATAGSDSTAKIWELDFKAGTGRLLATLVGYTSTVGKVEFSPDGHYLATSRFGEIKLWDLTDLSDGSVLEVLSLPDGRRAVFHPQANTLITAFADNTVRLITLSADKLATIAEERLTRTFTAVECQQYRIDPCPAEQ